MSDSETVLPTYEEAVKNPYNTYAAGSSRNGDNAILPSAPSRAQLQTLSSRSNNRCIDQRSVSNREFIDNNENNNSSQIAIEIIDAFIQKQRSREAEEKVSLLILLLYFQFV